MKYLRIIGIVAGVLTVLSFFWSFYMFPFEGEYLSRYLMMIALTSLSRVVLIAIILAFFYGASFVCLKIRNIINRIENKYLRLSCKYGFYLVIFIGVLGLFIAMSLPYRKNSHNQRVTPQEVPIKNIPVEPDRKDEIMNGSDDLQMGEYNAMNPDSYTVQKREEARQKYTDEMTNEVNKRCKKLRDDNDDSRKKLFKKLEDANLANESDIKKGEKIINDGWKERNDEIDKFCKEQLAKLGNA